MLRFAAGILVLVIIALFGLRLVTGNTRVEEIWIKPKISVISPALPSQTTEFSGERDGFVSYDPVTHIYSDEALGFTLSMPVGFAKIGEYDIFRTPDEYGEAGYADRSGMALTIEAFPKPTKQLPFEWFTSDDMRMLSVRESIHGRVGKRQSFHYKADWDTLGQSLGVVVDGNDFVLKLDCFHPPVDSYSHPVCSDALRQVTDSLVFK